MSTIAPLYIRKDDLQPYYYAQIKDASGAVVDITGASIRCTMTKRGGTVKINNRVTGISITDAPNGKFRLAWQSGDTDTVGKYYIKFKVTPLSGGVFTVPADPGEFAEVHIVPA